MNHAKATSYALLTCHCGNERGGQENVLRLYDIQGWVNSDDGLMALCDFQGFDGSYIIHVKFSGDITGGNLLVVSTFYPTFAKASATWPGSSDNIGISGNTLGFRDCFNPGINTSMNTELQIQSSNGNLSNLVNINSDI